MTPARAVLYLRQSVSREDSISLELQETACRSYCDQRGYQVVEVHADPGISGRTFARPGVTSTMQLIEDGSCDVIVLWKWSRLSRNRRDWALAADRVEVAGGSIESATEAVDVTTSTGRFTRGMLTEMAAFESERIGEQWRETHARRLRNGLPHTGTPRFGYLYSREQGYVPDPVTGPLLADLYRRYVAGEGFSLLTEWLNRNAVRTRNGRLWRSGRLLTMLDSGFGAGFIPTGRDRTLTHLPGSHPPVVDLTVWEAYRARRRLLSRVPARLQSPRWPLSGLLRCAKCGGTLEAYSRPLKDGPVGMYRCSSYTNLGPSACPGVWVRRSAVEDAVREWLAPHATETDSVAGSRPLIVAERKRARSDVTRLSRELAALQAEADRMAQAVAEGLPMGDYRRWRDRHDDTRRTVEQALVEAEQDGREMVRIPPARVRRLLADWESYPTAELREVLSHLVGRVVVARAEKFRGKPSVRVVARWESPR